MEDEDNKQVEKCCEETRKHTQLVRTYLDDVADRLQHRGLVHDASKFESPEKEVFGDNFAMLAKTEYGSEEYKTILVKLKPALEHHYSVNTHHPEHYTNGIDGMSLLDILEMLVDWKAAGQRSKNGDIYRSIEINARRFNISPQLVSILLNTIKELFPDENPQNIQRSI